MQMPLKERSQVYEEVHGVDEVIEESPAFVAERLHALDCELQTISHKPAYHQAERISAAYVYDPKFRLSFLRADYFDARRAAIRLVKFMEGKLKYFGLQVLARPITLNDLDPDDMEALESGYLQLLSARDRAGRAVLCDIHTMFPRKYKQAKNLVCTNQLLNIIIVERRNRRKTNHRSTVVSYTFSIAFHSDEILYLFDDGGDRG
jgi:hypothetical protein